MRARGQCVFDYKVVLVGDQDLPQGVDWAIARCDDRMVAFLKRSAITDSMLEEAWAAAEECQHPPRYLLARVS